MMDARHDDHPPDGGFLLDMTTTFNRRRALQMMLGAGAVAMLGAGCGDDPPASTPSSTTASTTSAGTTTTAGSTTSDAASCDTPIPQETAGPFPGDGTNGPNVLTQQGVERQDIRSSFAGMTGTADGVPLTMVFELLDANDGCSPLVGAAVYAWHCDRDGNYSLYSQAAADQNYLRGLQVAGTDGKVTFTSIFPGCYPGRWPHVHFEVFSTRADATSGGQAITTSQLALPKAICETVYTTSGYSASVGNLAQLSLQTDGVFGDDGAVHQLARMSGDPASALTATLVVPLSAS